MADAFIPVLINATACISAQYKQVLAGIKAAASKAGRTVCVFTEEGFEALDTDAWPAAAIATGTSLPFLRRVIDHMRRRDRRVVLAGTDSDAFGSQVSCATHSRRAETLQVLRYLSRCGRKRIALVGFNEQSINDRFRYHAALTARETLGIPLDREDCFTWSQEPEACFEAFRGQFGRYDAVVCPNDVMAVSFSNFCRDAGVAVPRQLFIASFGSMQISRWARPSITTTAMDDYQVGLQAVTVWNYVRENHALGTAMKVSLPSHIIPRESTACVPDQDALPSAPSKEGADTFYSAPLTTALVRLDDCLVSRDALDFKILRLLMRGDSYEAIAEALFIASSTLRYRLHKIYGDVGAASRAEFERIVHAHLGSGNPFDHEPEETR